MKYRFLRPAVVAASLCLYLPGVVCCSAQVKAAAQGRLARTHSVEEIARAKDSLTHEEFCGYCAQVLAETGSRDAIPALEQNFSRQTELLDKLKIAQVLVVLKDADPKYWDYLYGQATEAVDSEAPEPAAYNASGYVDLAGTPTPVFKAWMQSKGLSWDVASVLVSVDYPAAVGMLGLTEDPRAIPLLRRALQSPVYLEQIQAALSLAQFHDQQSVPQVIALCHTDPAPVAQNLAEALVYFDDTEAQKTVDAYLPKDEARIAREARAAGKTALF